MPMLPVPAFVALVLGYIALRAALSERRPLLIAFLAACSAQSALVALVGGYGIEVLRPVLPVSAAMIPPLALITFRDAMLGRLAPRRVAVHLAAPVGAALCRILAPGMTDPVVMAIFLGYGIAMLLRLRRAPDMPLARLEAGQVPVLIWRGLGWALIGSAAADAAIALAYMTGHAGWTGWVITVSSSLALLLLGLLSGSPAASGPEKEHRVATPAEPDEETGAEDSAILARVEAVLARDPLHLDPGLTLSRLARRLQLPEKRLSAAVNRGAGENVSRFVNARRIHHACRLIEGGASVTEAMLNSGFNTKSNFNREFRRVTGVAPSLWQGAEAPMPGVIATGGYREPRWTGPDGSARQSS
ncbi:helix-turn-helix domain-containing protein [Pseudoroseicyclus aestuarii]|uniref:AraC family transcriptional regulator n=1 Tax=Pseudoroseicyclus aestuarii TaxID=1795041 RepID=A0A318SW20_9RHOB|nr:AraC family transcriptional regulator [Pseudoroseicyclus aestuarii]PYE86050.1 AraC family transcriptional regulator [Pseudoroseicyclus aestuarii]